MAGMFTEESEASKAHHYAMIARRFAMDAKLLKRKAAVHVESKGDIPFWSAVLQHYRPNEKFHFIASSQNENGKRTSGVTQCLKYIDNLSKEFFICIDSDYRYLLGDDRLTAERFVLQTYTYSFENHLCLALGLNGVCENVTRTRNDVFDFKVFMKNYSIIIYDLFIWHLYLIQVDSHIFSKYDFNNYLNMAHDYRHLEIAHNGKRMLEKFQQRVSHKIKLLEHDFPKAKLEAVRQKYATLGLTPDTCYLFIRGHNVYDTVHNLCKEVCKQLLRRNKYGNFATQEAIHELYRNRHILDEYLRDNLHFNGYYAIEKIGKDIKCLFD